MLFSDNCSSGQSSQACTPNEEDNIDASSGVGSDVTAPTCSSSGNAFQTTNIHASQKTSTQLSPTKTLIQKFNNIGLESNSNLQIERQQYVQNR